MAVSPPACRSGCCKVNLAACAHGQKMQYSFEGSSEDLQALYLKGSGATVRNSMSCSQVRYLRYFWQLPS